MSWVSFRKVTKLSLMAALRMACWKVAVACLKRGDRMGADTVNEGGVTFACLQSSKNFVRACVRALVSLSLDNLLTCKKCSGAITCLKCRNMLKKM